jgi:hypothetical protein
MSFKLSLLGVDYAKEKKPRRRQSSNRYFEPLKKDIGYKL